MKNVLTDASIVEGLKKRSRLPLPLAGERHGKITVGSEFGFVMSGIPRLTVLCRCDCGTEKHLYVQYVRGGFAKSCGCAVGDWQRERAAAMPYKRTADPLYWVFRGMKQRCESQGDNAYPYYGGRGIAVASAWRHDFDAFRAWALANGYSRGLSIERLDNDGDYAPDNCCWATDKAQANNTRRNARLTAFGEQKTIAQWQDDSRCAVSASTLYSRRERGWEGESAIVTPTVAERGPRLSAFGEDRTLREWARDPRCVVSYKVLWQRLNRYGFAAEAALTSTTGLRTTRRKSSSSRQGRSLAPGPA